MRRDGIIIPRVNLPVPSLDISYKIFCKNFKKMVRVSPGMVPVTGGVRLGGPPTPLALPVHTKI